MANVSSQKREGARVPPGILIRLFAQDDNVEFERWVWRELVEQYPLPRSRVQLRKSSDFLGRVGEPFDGEEGKPRHGERLSRLQNAGNG
jgi:hypothetical protein